MALIAPALCQSSSLWKRLQHTSTNAQTREECSDAHKKMARPPQTHSRASQEKSAGLQRGGGAGIPLPSNCLQKGSGVILQSPPEWLGWSSLPAVSGMASPPRGARASPPL